MLRTTLTGDMDLIDAMMQEEGGYWLQLNW